MADRGSRFRRGSRYLGVGGARLLLSVFIDIIRSSWRYALMRMFLDLTKSGIIFFVLITGFTGYALGTPAEQPWDLSHLLLTLLALYFLSAGSFALNQAQEWRHDSKMPRTENRPIPSKKISAGMVYGVSAIFILTGLALSYLIDPLVGHLGLATVVLYNLLYTLYWKRQWAFAAVPGAIPGAMPVVIGYVSSHSTFWTSECLYAFFIMFLWQMPHFWALAIRYKDDYAKGGFPVLPVRIGTDATLYHIGLYTFAYVALAIASPWFTTAYLFYGFVVLPFAFKVLYEFYRYYQSGAKQRWLPFFLWMNVSMLIFLLAPVVDKWHRFFIGTVWPSTAP